MFSCFGLFSQSLSGTNGLFNTPSAFIYPDGNGYVGASFLPSGSYNYLEFSQEHTGMPTFFTMSFFDRVEFMFRYTHSLGVEVSPTTKYFPDRMFTIRYQLLKDAKLLPNVVVGFHDVSNALAGSSASPWFLDTYIVASKELHFPSFKVRPSLGYGFDFFKSSNMFRLNGFFGGVEIISNRLPNLALLIENDSRNFNIAGKMKFFDHLSFSIGVLGFNTFSGLFSYHFNLLSK